VLRVATWNINSIRIRGEMLADFVGEYAPDILCLQETKVQDHEFPHPMVNMLGYSHVALSGQKSYNGVTILSKLPLRDVSTIDVLENGDKRHISAWVEGVGMIHNLYVPAGGDIPDPTLNPKFADKLRFLRWMSDSLPEQLAPSDPHIVLGDFNIAPYENDVWSHKQLLDVVSHTPIEVEALARVRDSVGWIDSARMFVPMDQKLYSWWSYRNRDWQASDRGRRLDHIWVTPALKPRLLACHTIRAARGYESGSDHVPVMIDLSL
jgi:exodeoxyribonuclease III